MQQHSSLAGHPPGILRGLAMRVLDGRVGIIREVGHRWPEAAVGARQSGRGILRACCGERLPPCQAPLAMPTLVRPIAWPNLHE